MFLSFKIKGGNKATLKRNSDNTKILRRNAGGFVGNNRTEIVYSVNSISNNESITDIGR